MILPILASVSRALEIIVDKHILSRQKVDFRNYLIGVFLLVFVVAAMLGIFLGKINHDFFTLPYLLAFVGVVATATGWNAIFHRALQHEKLTDCEPIILATPLAVILIGIIFLPSERKWSYVILGVIAVLSLIVARFRKSHLRFNLYLLALVGYVLLFSFEALFTKVVLANINGFALYPIRVFFVTIILALLFRPPLKKTNNLNWLSFAAVAIIANAYYIFLYLSYAHFGITITTLFTVVQPVLIYLASLFFFKEKFNWRNIAAAVIVLACVITAQLI